MAANEYYGGPPPVYPPVPPQQGYGGGYPPQQQGYYSGPAPPAQYTGPDGKPHPFAHYLQQPAPLPPQPQPGFNYPQQYQQPGQVIPYGNPSSRPSSPLPPGAEGPQDRGLGSTLIGGIAGSTLAHKMGGGALGTIAGAVGGAILANVASHKIKDKKKKKKKSKKHGSRRRRGSSGSSDSESESDSDSSRSSGGRSRPPHGKRYALGYSTGGGSVFGPVAPRKSKRRHSSRSDSD